MNKKIKQMLAAGILGGGGVTFASSISPTIGNNIVTDGDAESAVVTNWPASGSPVTREKSTTLKHGGAQSVHIVTDAGGQGAQNFLTSQANTWYHLDSWVYVVSGDFQVVGTTAWASTSTSPTLTAAAWTEVFSAAVTTTGTNPRLVSRPAVTGAGECYLDDYYAKPLTLASCFATSRTGVAVTNVGAKVTAYMQQKIGVVANLDSITNPLNYVLAVCDTRNAWLFQVSNGVYTAKINGTAITYVADKVLEIRHTDATTYQLYYNGSQVGANQTISDAAINGNTLYAQFSTYSGNSFSSFTL